MTRSRVQRWAILLLTIGLLAVVPVSASAQTQSDVDRAERNKNTAEARKSQAYQEYRIATEQLEDAVREYERLWAAREELSYRIDRMEAASERYETEARELEERAKTIVLDAYTSGQRNLVGSAFTASSIQDLVTSQALIGRATERELANLDNLDAVSRQADRASAELDIRRADVIVNQEASQVIVDLMVELQAKQSSILAKADSALQDAISAYRREVNEKATEDARIKAQQAEKSASRPGAAGGAPVASTPGFICPVLGGASFIDSWGYPRSGGRKHKGVDMFAARGTKVVAVVDGRIKFSSNSLGGRSTHLYADNGTVYYYTHLDGHPSDVSSGQRVTKGTVVGFVGNTGNARYTSPHNHFEIRPNGKAVNPYPTVRSAC